MEYSRNRQFDHREMEHRVLRQASTHIVSWQTRHNVEKSVLHLKDGPSICVYSQVGYAHCRQQVLIDDIKEEVHRDGNSNINLERNRMGTRRRNVGRQKSERVRRQSIGPRPMTKHRMSQVPPCQNIRQHCSQPTSPFNKQKIHGDDRECFVLMIKELELGLEFTARVIMLRQFFVEWRN